MERRSLQQLTQAREKTEAEVWVQCVAAERKETKAGKPFVELSICDGAAPVKMRVWDNHPAFAWASTMLGGGCYALSGTWWTGDFGLESDQWTGRVLVGEEKTALWAGPPEQRAKQEADWLALTSLVAALPDGALKTLTLLLLNEHEEPYRRAGAARANHHARRGGLVEHVSLMAQAAMALCAVYPEVRRDLLLAGVVFHDAGKLVENQYQAEGFEMPYSFRAECYGHIAIGVQMAHRFWAKLPAELQERDRALLDALCHLILSHHGKEEWGSPVRPKLPEAVILHHVDMIDANLEMMRMARGGKLVAPGVFERQRTLGVPALELPLG